MHPYLTRLGISPEIQAFFEPFWIPAPDGSLWFDHGDGVERYAPGCHLVPLSARGWFAGERDLNLVRRVFICSSAMEAIAFLHGNQGRFNYLYNILFIATGLLPKLDLYSVKNKQVILINSTDILGHAADVRVKAAIYRQIINLYYEYPNIVLNYTDGQLIVNENEFSLRKVEVLMGARSNLRVWKPKGFTSWLYKVESSRG